MTRAFTPQRAIQYAAIRPDGPAPTINLQDERLGSLIPEWIDTLHIDVGFRSYVLTIHDV
jgi:hypothetical protein